MTTTPVSTAPPNVRQSKSKELKTEDFIKMMITQLQNQDPMEPAKNGELLQQMSQISQLQSSNTLQETIKDLAASNNNVVFQGQIASAGQLIGKMVVGTGAEGEKIAGVVTSVRVENNTVNLELDNGKRLPLGAVKQIAGSPQAVGGLDGSVTEGGGLIN